MDGSVSTLLLAGGIGSGKSTAARLLRSRGVPVYDADSRTKELYVRRPEIVTRLEDALGVPLRDGEGCFAPGLLARVVFSDPGALRATEAIVHPAVLEDFLGWRAAQVQTPWESPWGMPRFVVMESAIAHAKPLFRDIFDAVLLVWAPAAACVDRVVARDGLSVDQVLSRMAAQSFPGTEGECRRWISAWRRSGVRARSVDNSGAPDMLAPLVEAAMLRLARDLTQGGPRNL